MNAKIKYISISAVFLVFIAVGGFLIYKYWWLANFWLEPWKYRTEINVDNLKNQYPLNNYSVPLEINTAILIEEKKLSSDCKDIRFTDANKKTELSYWIEFGCNTEKTKIWVKIPNIPNNSDKYIYIYYGNPKASSKDNKAETVGITEGDFTMINTTGNIRGATNCIRTSIGYLYCGFNDDIAIHLLRSKDGGQNWEEALKEDTPHGGVHFSSIAVDSKDNIHLIWEASDMVENSPGSFVQSDYFQYLKINSSGKEEIREKFTADSFPGPMMAIDSKDNVHLVWSSYEGEGNWNLKYQERTVDGWSRPKKITDEAFQQSYAQIRIDSRDNIYLTWAGYDSKGQNRVIKYQENDGGWLPVEIVGPQLGNNLSPYSNLDIVGNIQIVWLNYPLNSILYQEKIKNNIGTYKPIRRGQYPLICPNLNDEIYLLSYNNEKDQSINVDVKQKDVSYWSTKPAISLSSKPVFSTGQGPTANCVGIDWTKNNGVFSDAIRQGFVFVYSSNTGDYNEHELKFYASEDAVMGIAETEPEIQIGNEDTTIFNKMLHVFDSIK